MSRVLFAGGPKSKYTFQHEVSPRTGHLRVQYRGQTLMISKEEVEDSNERRLRGVIRTWADIVDRSKEIRI